MLYSINRDTGMIYQIDVWYDRHVKTWTLDYFDANGNLMEETEYEYKKVDAVRLANARLKEANALGADAHIRVFKRDDALNGYKEIR